MSSQRSIATRSKSRDEMDSDSAAAPASAKENVSNEKDYSPPPSRTTPRRKQQQNNARQTSTGRTKRSAASLFSPTPYSSARRTSPSSASSFVERSMASMGKPDPFPDNWEEAMGQPSSASRRSNRREPQQQDSFSYGNMPQSDSRGDDRKTMWEQRSEGGGGEQQIHRDTSNSNYGSLAADLEMAAREGVDDFPAVADCLNLGSFAEESPPRHVGRQRSSPHKASPTQAYNPADQGQPYPYRSSPRHQQQRAYPPHASPPPPFPHVSGGPPQYPGAPPIYYPPQGPLPGSPYGYPPPPGQHYPRYPPPHQPYQADAWMSPPTRFPDFPPPPPPPEGGGSRDTPLRGSPPPKKRRNTDWDSNGGGTAAGTNTSSSSSPGQEGDEAAGSTTPEKVQIEPSPFRSPEKGSANRKYKRSPLFQGGTPGIGAYGSWDTPGGTLNAALSDAFSPMGPSFAPFDADETLLREGGTDEGAPMPFDAKLDLAASSVEEPPAPPSIRQRPRQPAASPFSAFVGELSPFPPPMRGSPVNRDQQQRDYPPATHPGQPPFHRSSPPDDYPRHLGMPTPSKRSGIGPPPPPPPPANRPAHPMASPVMSGSAQRHQPWYEHMGPSPGPFRLELGDGKTRKGFEDINSLLRGANGPPPPHPRPSPPSDRKPRYDSGSGQPRPSSTPRNLSTPIKAAAGPPIGSGGVPGSAGRVSSYHGSARKTPMGSAQTPRYTPMSKARSTSTPGTGSKTPLSGAKGGRVPFEKRSRRQPCNCKKSKCLKLYCECFAQELYCDGCNCNDCHNSTAYEAERQKSMKDTRAKNPNAFKARITVKSSSGGAGTTTPAGGHNMGCRCKKSECLKKYCECFQAGVMCGSKCKCVDCLNYVGSQALIDKRRKMKDHRGAELAMRIADEAWKGGKHSAPRGMNPRGLKPSPAVSQRGPPLPLPHMMQPSPSPHHHGPPPPPPPPRYMGPMMGPPIGYSPMGMPAVTPGYGRGKKPMVPAPSNRGPEVPKGKPKVDTMKQQGRAPKTVTPRTPGKRLGFDPHSSKKKRKLSPGDKEPTFPYFGDLPEQPKTTALAIFSYLSNDDVFNSTLVCKQWNKLAMDDELWQF